MTRSAAAFPRWTLPVTMLLAAVVGTGCGPSGPKTYPVSGTVTFEGEPLAEGDIVFSPEQGSIAPDAGKIVDGKFEFRAQPGPKRVEIDATRETGEVDPTMGMAPRESFIPSKYNTETTLEAEVTAGGENEFHFELLAEGGEEGGNP